MEKLQQHEYERGVDALGFGSDDFISGHGESGFSGVQEAEPKLQGNKRSIRENQDNGNRQHAPGVWS